MEHGSSPIGFEGIFKKSTKAPIGFEKFEHMERETPLPAYPLTDTMPSPRQLLENDSSSPTRKTMPNPPYPSSHTLSTSRRSLPCLQLAAIYHEIVDVWSEKPWLEFADEHTHNHLTLDVKTDEILSIQTALDEYRVTTGETQLISSPECLLIRSKSKSKTVFIPNMHISLENFIHPDVVQIYPTFKLLAIISHLNDIHSPVMLYKHSQSNSWYIYHHESILAPAHSELLSEDEHEQIESFIQLQQNVDPYEFSSPLSALLNHPITYVYMSQRFN